MYMYITVSPANIAPHILIHFTSSAVRITCKSITYFANIKLNFACAFAGGV